MKLTNYTYILVTCDMLILLECLTDVKSIDQGDGTLRYKQNSLKMVSASSATMMTSLSMLLLLLSNYYYY